MVQAARLLRTGGEIGDEAKQRVAGADQPIEAGLGQVRPLRDIRLRSSCGSAAISDSILAEMTTQAAPSAFARASTWRE